MSTDNAGKPAKADVPPHNRILKFYTPFAAVYAFDIYGRDALTAKAVFGQEIICQGRFKGENAGTY